MQTEVTGWLAGAAKAIAATVIIGGGATILSTSQQVAVHEHRLEKVEAVETKIDKLNENLSETNKNIAVLNERLNQVQR
jgi:uncharacterized protein (DUF342 family)